MVFDGQSLVNVPPWEGDEAFGIFGWSWPRLAMALQAQTVPGYDQPAVGGTSLTTLASSFPTRARPWITPASFEPTIYVLCGGTQDVLDGDTGAQIYADAGALADLARAAGAVYVVCTTTHPATGFTAGQNTQRLAGNALILADASGKFNATINFEQPGLDNPADPRSYFDGTHIYGSLEERRFGTGRGAELAAPTIAAAIAAVI